MDYTSSSRLQPCLQSTVCLSRTLHLGSAQARGQSLAAYTFSSERLERLLSSRAAQHETLAARPDPSTLQKDKRIQRQQANLLPATTDSRPRATCSAVRALAKPGRGSCGRELTENEHNRQVRTDEQPGH